LAAESKSPSFLAVHPTHQLLYCVNEEGLPGKKGGAISAFALDPKTGTLKALNQETSGGDGPCYLVVDPKGKNVLAANYGGGSVTVVPLKDDGSLGKPTAFIQHEGKGAEPTRQSEPHAHSINVTSNGDFAFAADLGLDKILIYQFDANKGTLTPNKTPFVSTAPAAGPRHLAIHPSGHFAYVVNEMNMTVTAYDLDPIVGTLEPQKSVTTLPKGAQGKDFSTAEVQVHPSGKFLYASNRGHNSIAIFSINYKKTGALTPVGHATKDIKTPRGFGIDPTGQYLIVGNQDGNSLTVFKIDQNTGELTEVGEPVEAPMPVCVKFVPIPK
jgi:6-phosphogluconolactonase